MFTLNGYDLFTEVLRGSGALVVSSFVEDGRAPGAWSFTKTYYGYDLDEALEFFVAECERRGYRPEVES